MRIGTTQQAGTVVIEGVQKKSSTFKIEGNLKAFRVLSDGLYSDKIQSIIRELCCNAYDAHIAAGKFDIPFKIHFPTTLEPYFLVHDDGVGLSDADLYNLYTTYFSSSKDQSNDYVGALGLGSKSPFSYVETFTVSSRYQGMKRVYTAFINEDGIPEVQQMAEEPSDETNGIEVQFPVEVKDIREFHEKGARVLEFFDPKPEHNIRSDFRIPKETYLLEGVIDSCSWGIRKTPGARAIMGPVAYPLDASTLDNENAAVINSMGIDIEFPMGELEVAASREKISFTKRVKENVNKRLTKVYDQLADRIRAKIDECPDLFTGMCTAGELIDNTDVGRVLNIIFGNKKKLFGQYKNFELKSKDFVIEPTSYKTTIISFTNFETQRFKDYPVRQALTPDIDVADFDNPNNIRYYKKEIRPVRNMSIMICDVTRGFNQVLKYMNQRNSGAENKTLIFLTFRGGLIKENTEIGIKTMEETASKIAEACPGIPIEYLSSYTHLVPAKVKVEKAEKKPRVRKDFFSFCLGRKAWCYTFEHETNLERFEDGEKRYFIPVFRNKPVVPQSWVDLGYNTNNFDDPTSFSTFVNSALEAKFLDKETEIVGIRVDTCPVNDPLWINLLDEIEIKAKSFLTDDDFKLATYFDYAYHHDQSWYRLTILLATISWIFEPSEFETKERKFASELDSKYSTKLSNLNKDSVQSTVTSFLKCSVGKYITKMYEIKKKIERTTNARHIAVNCFHMEIKTDEKRFKDLIKELKDIETKYPMSRYSMYELGDHESTYHLMTSFTNYVNLVDKQ